MTMMTRKFADTIRNANPVARVAVGVGAVVLLGCVAYSVAHPALISAPYDYAHHVFSALVSTVVGVL